jgi:hypothetical protein
MQQKLTFGFSTNKVDQVKPNQRITFAELRDIITNRTSCPPQYDELQALAVDQYVNGSKLARAKLLQKKRMLPWVTLQGLGHQNSGRAK